MMFVVSAAVGKTPVQDGEKGSSKVISHDRRVSEEQNNESQKLKVCSLSHLGESVACDLAAGGQVRGLFGCVQVLEEREKLTQDREIRMKKKEYLMKELERLRKQQG